MAFSAAFQHGAFQTNAFQTNPVGAPPGKQKHTIRTRRIPIEEFERLRLDPSHKELEALELAAEKAEQEAQKTRDAEKREALKAAAEAAEEISSGPPDEIRAVSEAIERALTAKRATKVIAEARRAQMLAEALVAAFRKMEDDEEEETMRVLLLHA